LSKIGLYPLAGQFDDAEREEWPTEQACLWDKQTLVVRDLPDNSIFAIAHRPASIPQVSDHPRFHPVQQGRTADQLVSFRQVVEFHQTLTFTHANT
jgi:hypothetical protein